MKAGIERGRAATIAMAGTIAIVGVALAGVGHAADFPPNVILISLDTVRADFLTFDDPETAQNMVELAQRGTIFESAVSATSWTLPAHVQMFTGTPPTRHGVETDFEMIDPLTPLLPQILDRAGYFTAGAFTARYLWGDYGFARGFDFYRSAIRASDLIDGNAQSAPRGKMARERARKDAEGAITAPNIVALARRTLERVRPDEPLFLFLHLFDPHSDYVPPEPWNTRFDPDYDGDLDPLNFYYNKKIFDSTKQPARQISDRDLDYIKALYRGEIAWTDQAVGEILELLDLHGRLDESLIVIVADHGEEFFEHGSHYHRKTLYDESIRVPLLIVPPKSMRDGLVGRVEAQVGLSDLLPTILDFAGIEAPESQLGRSLKPAMYGEAIPDRPQLLSLYSPADTRRNMYVPQLIQGIRTNEYKLLRRFDFGPGSEPTISVQYYDLVNDPGEQSPHGLEDPRLVEAWRELEDELDVVRARVAADPRTPDAERRTDVRESFVEELLALGYLEGEAGDPAEAPRPWGGLAPMPRMDPQPSPASPGGWAAWIPIASIVMIAGSAIFAASRFRARR